MMMIIIIIIITIFTIIVIKNISLGNYELFARFVESEISLPYSQQPVNFPRPEPNYFIPCPLILYR